MEQVQNLSNPECNPPLSELFRANRIILFEFQFWQTWSATEVECHKIRENGVHKHPKWMFPYGLSALHTFLDFTLQVQL
jgi:hypothetical protein